MRSAFAVIIAATSISFAMDSAPAEAGILAIGVGRPTLMRPAQIIPVDWGHHHCWWIKGRRICRK